jgi:hypothetical protein
MVWQYIAFFTASCLQESMWAVAPDAWRRCQAAHWASDAPSQAAAAAAGLAPSNQSVSVSSNSVATSGAGRGLAAVSGGGGGGGGMAKVPSELLVYVLWRDVLTNESAMALEALHDW